MMQKRISSLWKRIRQPRARGVVIGICATAIGVLIYLTRPGPAPAAASHNVAVNSVQPPATAPVDQATVSNWLDSQKLGAKRNPFEVDLNAFPSAGNQELGKSGLVGADQRKQQPETTTELERAAAALRLQSVVMGMPPSAVINGVSAKEGDVVASFRIARIESSDVVVEKDGVEFDIALEETNSRRVD